MQVVFNTGLTVYKKQKDTVIGTDSSGPTLFLNAVFLCIVKR